MQDRDLKRAMNQSKLYRVVTSLILMGGLASCLVSTPRGQYQRAIDAISQGQYNRGISELGQVIKSEPNFAEAYMTRGIAYSETGQIKAAIADYQKAIEINPELVEAYYNLGNAHMQAKAYPEAIAAYTQTLEPVSYTHLTLPTKRIV